MKIHNRPQFILALFCILPIIYEYKHYAGESSWVWIGLYGFIMIRALIRSFIKRDDTNKKAD